MDKIRFGVIGCGSIAKKAFIPALKRSENAELIAVASRSKEKAQAYAGEFDCIPVIGYSELLLRNDIDVVYIATPIGLHARWCVATAKAGKHIICEKTLSTCVDDTQNIINVCKSNNIALLEGFSYQYHRQHAIVREIVNNGEIGTPVLFQAWFGFPPIDSKHRYDPALGGGALLDAGTYTVHSARIFFKKEPNNIKAILDYGKWNVDIHGTVLLNFGDGEAAQLAFGFNNSYKNSYSIWGTKGQVTVKRAFSTPSYFSPRIIVEKQNLRREEEIAPCDPFLLEIETFCSNLNDSYIRGSWRDDALAQARVLEAIRKSAE